jgi:NADPH-dependent 2,4-dienoyl-CoA reductase/sulfur reductase-like enzyme
VFNLQKTNRPKKVWVIGGGPGGMKAAEIASRRGHDVSLYEGKERLGGRFLLAAIPPRKQILNELVGYLQREIEKLPVRVVLGKLFDPALLREERPDVIVLATGAKPSFPEIDGIKESQAISVDDALAGSVDIGKRVLIVGGGGIGAEAADLFSEEGKEVTLAEMMEGIALDLVGHLQYFLNARLKAKGVRILVSAKAVRFEKGALWVETPQGNRRLEGFDSIVIAMGSVSNDELAESLKKRVSEFYVIGDASKPREVMEALFEAEEIALKI